MLCKVSLLTLGRELACAEQLQAAGHSSEGTSALQQQIQQLQQQVASKDIQLRDSQADLMRRQELLRLAAG